MSTWRVIIVALFVAITFGAAMTLAGAVSAGEMESRVSGKTNANSIGVSCMIGLLLGYPQLWLKTRLRWVIRGAMLIPLVLLYLSGSRSSLGGLLVGTAFSFWAMRRVKAMLVVFTALAVISIFYFSLYASPERKEMLVDDFKARVLRGETVEELLSSRQSNWEDCLIYWRLRPALGWGFSATDPSGDRPIAGSGYHGLLASVGVVGCVGFGFHLLVLMFTEYKHRKRRFSVFPDTDPQNCLWLFSTGAGLSAGMLVQGIGEPWMIGIGSVMTFAYLFALGALLSSVSWADILERQQAFAWGTDPRLQQRPLGAAPNRKIRG
jgi:O-antigen ligase